MNKPLLVLLFLSICSCSIDRTIDQISEIEIKELNTFQNLPDKSILHIAEQNEPGEKLLLCLTFINKESKKHLPEQQVHFYHTSENGDYELTDPNDDSTARLNGKSITDEKGRIYIETILPGNYSSSADQRHIHTTVYDAKPNAYDIHFKQYTDFMGAKFAKGSDQHFLADLRKTKDNVLVTFLTIEVKNTDRE